jgi:hypothetical protein
MARFNPCFLLIPLPIAVCMRSRTSLSTGFTTLLFLFFWVSAFVGIDQCVRDGTCANTVPIWVFVVLFYFLALFAQFDMFDEEYVNYKERRERFRDAEERARLLEEKKREEFKKKYSFRSMAKEADRVAKARRRSTLLGQKLPSMTIVELRQELGRLQNELDQIKKSVEYDDEEKNVLIAIFERDLQAVVERLWGENSTSVPAFERAKTAARGDRVPRFSDVV